MSRQINRRVLQLSGALFGVLSPLASIRPQAAVSAPPTEVVLIGGLHWQHVYTPGYSFAHLRALLERIRPDVLGIERTTGERPPGRPGWCQ